MERPCILVIEDNASDVQLFRLALDEAGLDCELMVIRDGAEAVQWVESMRQSPDGHALPHMAVVDLNLPKYDGFEVLAMMRATETLTSMPVMVLSSSVSPRDIARVQTFSNTRYVPKPVDLDEYSELGRKIRAMLNGG